MSVAYPQIGESPITQLEKTQLFDFSHPATTLKNCFSAPLRLCASALETNPAPIRIMGLWNYGNEPLWDYGI